MNVVGIETNVGSMLYPFQEKGHNIVAATDSRRITKAADFNANFPNSRWFDEVSDLIDYIKEIDIKVDVVMAQPSCSKFSNMSRKDKCDYAGYDNIFKSIAILDPDYFFIESKMGFINEIVKIPGYRYQVEWVSNWGYGNTQKHRNRLWVIGVKENINWQFIPNEKEHHITVESIINDLPDYDVVELEHTHIHKPFYKNSITKERYTLDEEFEQLKKTGKLNYIASDGTVKNRIGRKILSRVDAPTIIGTNRPYHYDKKYPITVREMARIQGFPDEFTFKYMPITRKLKAIGKSVPLQFVREIVNQLEGNQPERPSRLLPVPIEIYNFNQNFNKNH